MWREAGSEPRDEEFNFTLKSNAKKFKRSEKSRISQKIKAKSSKKLKKKK